MSQLVTVNAPQLTRHARLVTNLGNSNLKDRK